MERLDNMLSKLEELLHLERKYIAALAGLIALLAALAAVLAVVLVKKSRKKEEEESPEEPEAADGVVAKEDPDASDEDEVVEEEVEFLPPEEKASA